MGFFSSVELLAVYALYQFTADESTKSGGFVNRANFLEYRKSIKTN